MTKIKILFAINCMNIGGAPSVVFHQLKGIDKDRFDPYILTLYPSKKANFFSQMDFLDEKKIKKFKLKNRSLFDVRTLFQIYRFMKKERFDVVYTHLFLTNLLVRIVAILVRVPVILAFEHSTYHNKSSWQIFLDNILARWTKNIVVSTQAVAQFTAKQERISIDKFFVLPNPLYLPDRDEDKIQEIKKNIGIQDHHFVILTVGRFSEEKGHDVLIQAAQILQKTYTDMRCLIVGHGPRRQHLISEVQKKNLGDYCIIVEDPHSAKMYYYMADLFVLPSFREGQSIVTYEALMAGVPVVASDIQGVRDVVQDKKNGILFDAGNVEDLVNKIVYMYKNKTIRESYVLEGENIVDGYIEKAHVRHLEECMIRAL